MAAVDSTAAPPAASAPEAAAPFVAAPAADSKLSILVRVVVSTAEQGVVGTEAVVDSMVAVADPMVVRTGAGIGSPATSQPCSSH